MIMNSGGGKMLGVPNNAKRKRSKKEKVTEEFK